MKTILLIIAAFLIQLTAGKQILIRDARGFVIVEVEGIMCHGFFDRIGTPLMAIPSGMIAGAQYIPDDKVM